MKTILGTVIVLAVCTPLVVCLVLTLVEEVTKRDNKRGK
jgi:hypothetical protein